MNEALREGLKQVAPYPLDVIPVTDIIQGTAFFPGGRGLWMEDSVEDPKCPTEKIMVLGHNFDSADNYRRSVERGREDVKSNPTWRNLIDLLRTMKVEPADVFFTNFYMGLGLVQKNTGKFPGASDREFVARCGRFFIEQLVNQRPKVVLVLGTPVPPLIAQYSQELQGWRNARSFSTIDGAGPLVRNAKFSWGNSVGHTATVAALTHPCLRNSNVRYRNYAGLKGKEAECQLLEDALS